MAKIFNFKSRNNKKVPLFCDRCHIFFPSEESLDNHPCDLFLEVQTHRKFITLEDNGPKFVPKFDWRSAIEWSCCFLLHGTFINHLKYNAVEVIVSTLALGII